jgi:CRISPR-associated protein Csx10
MKQYNITLTQLSTVCLGNSRDKQNIFYTHDFIQGGRLWGYVINKYFKKYKQVHDDLFNDNIRFHNCYMQTELENQTCQALPVPLSLFTCKTRPYSIEDEQNTCHDLLDLLFTDDTVCMHCSDDSPLKQVQKGYFYKAGKIGIYNPRKIIEMHNRIDKATQNTKSDSLFSYQLLDETGKKYRGQIQVAEDSDLIEFIENMNGEKIGIGKARTSGYGCFQFQIQEGTSREMDVYFDNDFGDTVNVYLLSDLIIMDEFHRYQTVLTPQLLGLEKELELVKSFCCGEKIQGFNAKHQRPRIDDIAIKKGSCFLYSLRPGANRETIQTRIQEIESGSIGLRKNEGFGRLRFNRKQVTGVHTTDKEA